MDLEIVNKNDFERVINIRFDNILDGFDRYNYIELSPRDEVKNDSEEYFIKTVEAFYEVNEGNLIIDFYKKNLNDNSIELIKKHLDSDEKAYFDELINFATDNEYFYKVNNKKYIKLFTRLCTKELYFITFYFYMNPITLWGNYNLKFPLFYDDNTNTIEYINIAKANKLY